MTEPTANLEPPEQGRPQPPRRAVAPWEYRTAYIESFQLRLPDALYQRLRSRAQRERTPLADLLIAILEEAVRRRGGQAEADGGQPAPRP
jgi:hypothetical protein